MNGGDLMNQRTINMTEGKPLSLMIRFAIPLMLGNIFQQLYTMIDTMIVGQGVGVKALASLGAADWLNWMVIGVVTGFCQGFSIIISQAVGAGNQHRVNKSVALSTKLAIGIAIILTILAHLLCIPILKCLNTPLDIIDGSITYLRVIFSGIIVTMAYNLFSSILRSFGDSKTPLVAMVIGSVTNIVLDLFFVYQLNWGIFGAAFATVIAQVFASCFCFIYLCKLPQLKLTKQDFVKDSHLSWHLIKMGSPVAFQNAIISIGGLIVQYVINGYGFIFVAGFTATNKLYGVLELAAVSYGYAIATFAGQNHGAGKIERIKSGVKQAVILSIVTSVVISIVMIIFGKNIVSLFVSGNQPEVIQVAYKYLFIMSICLSILFLLHMYRNALQGMGDTLRPMISGIIELVCRISVALLLPLYIGQDGIYYAEIIAWLGAELYLMYSYYKKIRLTLSTKNH